MALDWTLVPVLIIIAPIAILLIFLCRSYVRTIRRNARARAGKDKE